MPHIYCLDPAATKYVDLAAAIAKDIAARHADDVDANGRFPTEAIAALGNTGLLGLTLPPEVGGCGQGPRTFIAVAEELAMACASTAMVYVMHVSATMPIAVS